MKKITVKDLTKEEKLGHYILKKYRNLNEGTLYKAIRNKDIRVNGIKTTNENERVKNGDEIEIYIPDFTLYGFPKTLDIVYEDENILVINKPQGVITNNEEEKIEEPTFEEYVKKSYNENARVCHRLDRNTSGLLIFSKNDKAYDTLTNGFRDGNIQKEYIAYVSGSDIVCKNAIYENYIVIDKKRGFSKVYDTNVSGSQRIVTEVSLLYVDKEKDYSILRVTIHTGKTHQIRSFLAHILHPIIGDSKYGKNEINKKYKKYKQLLFAAKYTFSFPRDSYLSYLNDVVITLNEKNYMNKI